MRKNISENEKKIPWIWGFFFVTPSLGSLYIFYFKCDNFVKSVNYSKSWRKNQSGMEVAKWFWEMQLGTLGKCGQGRYGLGKKNLSNHQAFMVEPVGEGHAEWNSSNYSVYCETLQLSWIINLIWHWNFLPVLMNGFSPHLMTQGCFLSSFQGRSCPLCEGQELVGGLVWFLHPFLRLPNPMK